MKQLTILLLLLFTLDVSAQVDTISNPPGYSSTQLQYKNILRVSPDDHIWIGFEKIGAGEFDGSSWRMYNDTNGLPSKNVTAFAFDGTIRWIGTDKGIVKIDGVNFQIFDSLNSPLPSNKINYLFKSGSVLWIATNGGIISYDGSNWINYNTSNSTLTSDTILCFNKNNFGVYASTYTGIFLLRNNIWKFIGTELSRLNRITSDASGHLFTATHQILDTVLVPVTFPSDPCYFQDNLITSPNYILGGIRSNEVFIVPSSFLSKAFIIVLDSSLNINKTYQESDFFDTGLFYQTSHFFQDDMLTQLFDFNSNNEIISTRTRSIGRLLNYKINFSGIPQVQQTDSCPYLDINQVQARIGNNGSMFWDLTGQALYEVPKGSGKTAMFGEGLWIGGRDSQNKLHIAAQTYRQSGNDFWPGPLDTTNATIDSSTSILYDKLWKIDKTTLIDFLWHFQNGDVTNGTYTIPSIIQNWPAHGNGNITRNLAPFIDVNSDGIYNPHDGDYPSMKGDQMFWWVFNDNLGPHGETGSLANLGVEIHGSAYAYNCPQLNLGDSVINYTTFYHYDFINRSDTSYHDVYSGILTDVDLGNYLDDYVGCDTINDIAFTFNGDNDDDEPNGYGINPPMINLAVLKGPEASPNDGIDNNHNGVNDEPGENCMLNCFNYFSNDFTITGNPSTANHYYWKMQSLWKDSTHVVYGGDGYDTSSTDYTNFMFSGHPYDSIGWSEKYPCSGCNSNEPSDRRMVVSSGPFDLPANGKRSLDYAYVYTREPNFPNGSNTSLVVNHDQVMRIKHFFEIDSFPCDQIIGVDEIFMEDLDVSLFPNPALSEIFVTILNDEPGLKTYFLSDVVGQTVSGNIKTNSSSFRIDLSKLSAGIYFLHIMTGKKNCVKKFIIQ